MNSYIFIYMNEVMRKWLGNSIAHLLTHPRHQTVPYILFRKENKDRLRVKS